MLDHELQQILHHKIQFQPLHLQVLFELICRNHLIHPIEYAIILMIKTVVLMWTILQHYPERTVQYTHVYIIYNLVPFE